MRPGQIALDCNKGTAQLSIPVHGDSVIGDWRALGKAISDLVLLAKPQKTRILFETPPHDVAPIEVIAADEIRKATGAVEVQWAADSMTTASMIERPLTKHQERAGWVFFRAGRSAPAAKLRISRGSITLEWKGQTATEAIPVHSRLVVSDYCALADSIIRAKRALRLPHGLTVDISIPEEFAPLSAIEHQAVAEAVLNSHLNTTIPWQQEENIREEKAEISWAFKAGAFIIVFTIILVRSYMKLPPVSFLQAIGAGIVGYIAILTIDTWRKYNARKRLVNDLLQPHHGTK